MKKNEYITHSNNSTFQKPRQKEPGPEEQTENDSICETGKVAFGPQLQEADE